MDFRNHLLCELSDFGRRELATRLRPVTLRHGEILQYQAEEQRYCFFIESGVVTRTRMLADGGQVEAGLVGREGMVGSLAGPSPAFTQAKVEIAGEALRIEAEMLRSLLPEISGLRDVLARYHQFQLEEAQLNAVCNVSHSIDERLAKWLLRCLDRIDEARLKVTQEFLAEMLGVQRTTVTAALQRLGAHGAVRTGRAAVEVVDRDGLEDLACECYEHAAARLPELGLPEASDRTECPAA